MALLQKLHLISNLIILTRNTIYSSVMIIGINLFFWFTLPLNDNLSVYAWCNSSQELNSLSTNHQHQTQGELKFQEAERLKNGTLEDKKISIEKYNEALNVFQKAGNRSNEANTLNSIGSVYRDLSEIPQAMEKYKQALKIFLEINDRNGEAQTLNNIGLANILLEKYSEAMETLSRALQYFQEMKNRNGEADVLNNIGLAHKEQKQLPQAIEKYKQALQIARAVNDRLIDADILTNLGNAYHLSGNQKQALEVLNEALSISEVINNQRFKAIGLGHMTSIYRTLGDTQTALEKMTQAVPLYRASGDRDGEASSLNNIGILHQERGELRQALEKYDQALPIFQAMGNRRMEGGTLNNIGIVYRMLGDTQQATKKYDQALQIFQAINDRRMVAFIYNNTGVIYRGMGEMQQAIDNFNQALSIFRTIGEQHSEAGVLNNIGSAFRILGEPQQALEKHIQALQLYRSIGNRRLEATTLNNIGTDYQSLGEMKRALEHYLLALQLTQATGDRIAEASSFNYIGVIYREFGDMQRARENLNSALTLFQSAGDRRLEATALYNIGTVLLIDREIPQAIDKFNQALSLFRSLSDRNGEAVTLLEIGRAEQKRGNVNLAIQIIEQATSMVESLRTNITNRELRASYLASQQKFFESYINVLMEQHHQSPSEGYDEIAFAVSERARARSLLELLVESRADIRRDINPLLLEQERSLQQRLNAKAIAQVTLSNQKHTAEQAKAISEEMDSIFTEYDKLKGQIRLSSPRYAMLTQPQPLTLKDTQQQVLDSNSLLLEYSLGDRESYLFAVTKTSSISYILPKRADIEVATRQVLELITSPYPNPGESDAEHRVRIEYATANYQRKLIALSRMLLGPVASQLGNKRLLIVADGALHYLPFSVIPIPDSSMGGGKHSRSNFTPLIIEHEIIHLPSASMMAILRQEPNTKKSLDKTIAVIADPVFSPNDSRVKSTDKTGIGKEAATDLTRSVSDIGIELNRLLMTRDEADAILSITPPNEALIALDFRANRSTVTSTDLSPYRIVHFATHGILNSKSPELSGLVLSLVDEQGQPQDGFLRLHEIFNLKIPAELVVLSACQTGLGKDIKGEGLVGLIRGFMYAGSKQVMASLWQVNDAATAELMKLFYRKMMLDRKRPAAALREAQIEMWKKRHRQFPFYWGAFVIQGDWK